MTFRQFPSLGGGARMKHALRCRRWSRRPRLCVPHRRRPRVVVTRGMLKN